MDRSQGLYNRARSGKRACKKEYPVAHVTTRTIYKSQQHIGGSAQNFLYIKQIRTVQTRRVRINIAYYSQANYIFSFAICKNRKTASLEVLAQLLEDHMVLTSVSRKSWRTSCVAHNLLAAKLSRFRSGPNISVWNVSCLHAEQNCLQLGLPIMFTTEHNHSEPISRIPPASSKN